MALWKVDDLRSLGMDSMSVKVQAGEVWLLGHVVKAYHRRLAEDLVKAVPGVKRVHNELVIDSDLVVEVAQVLLLIPAPAHTSFLSVPLMDGFSLVAKCRHSRCVGLRR